jgi:class 3 adenylate cyclase
MGDLQIVSLRPFGRAHLGAVSDTINMASRLLSAATQNEIVVSNSFLRKLSPTGQASFQPMEPIDARNMGRITAWKRTSE